MHLKMVILPQIWQGKEGRDSSLTASTLRRPRGEVGCLVGGWKLRLVYNIRAERNHVMECA